MNDQTIQAALDTVGTPLYLFDEEEFHRQSLHLRSLLPSDAELCYAIKANPFIIEQAARDADRIEVCSPGELRICQALDIPADKLVISGVHKDEALARELTGGKGDIARYTVESTLQFDLLEEAATDAGRRIPILIRLAHESQFGIDEPEIKTLVRRCIDNPHMDFCGIQLFAGTQKTSTKRMRHELNKADALMREIREELGMDVREFEYGAGLPVLYFEPDEEARQKQDHLASELAELLGAMEFTGKIIIELGRAMAASCGWYATRVVDTKNSGGNNYAIIDGGKHQLVYYGNAMGMSQPPCSVFPTRAGDEQPWNICGSLCTTTDILAKKMPLPAIGVDDVLLFRKAGAYCMTEGVSLFLSRDLPAVVIADRAGNLRIAREHVDTFPLNVPARKTHGLETPSAVL